MREIQDSRLPPGRQPLPGRRALLAGAGVTCAAMLAGCGGGVSPAASGTATSAAGSSPATADSAPAGSATAAGALVATYQVPDGGGKIIDGPNVVVTQPQPGAFRAFTAICTHQGCIVSSVSDGTINCPCHGSKFSIKDGSVVHGPAIIPLPAIAIRIEGTSIFQG